MARRMLLVGVCVWVALPGVGWAQGRDCTAPERPSAGVAFGKSLPYVFVAPPADAEIPRSSSLEGGGPYASARADFSPVSRLRLRVEASATLWSGGEAALPVSVRQAGVAIGLRGGPDRRRWPGRPWPRTVRTPCWYALAGVGMHSLTLDTATVRSPGTWMAGGMEIPAGPRGVVQLEAQLHAIHVRDRRPFSGSGGLALMLMAGWAYRF